MKVMFCLPDFRALGVQRVVAALAKSWPARAELIICVHERKGELLETLPPSVRVLALRELSPVARVPKLRVLARPLLHARAIALERPDAVVSFVPGDNLSLLALPRKFALAVSENIHVTSQVADYPASFRLPYLALFPRLYPKADAIICVAEESRADLVERWGMPREKTVLIPNPVDLQAVRAGVLEEARFGFADQSAGPIIVGAGRLDWQKRFDRLLGAVAQVRKTVPVRLAILGEGPLRPVLEAQARALGLARQVWFAGFQRNPWRFFARADLFALSSDYEGFPLVLAEAMVAGLPIVSLACPSGPREMLDEGRAGLLVDELSEGALARGLLEALQDREAARARAARALERVEEFAGPAVAERYLVLCERLSRALR